MRNFRTTDLMMRHAEGITLPSLSGLMTAVEAGSDVCAARNLSARVLGVTLIQVRWVTETPFDVAQSLAFRINQVHGFTTTHNAGGKVCQAHYKYQAGIAATAVGERINPNLLVGYTSLAGAITGGIYMEEDADEPDLFAVGAGSTLPGVLDDWSCAPDGLVMVLPQNTGIVVNLQTSLVGAGAGRLFLGLHGFWLPE